MELVKRSLRRECIQELDDLQRSEQRKTERIEERSIGNRCDVIMSAQSDSFEALAAPTAAAAAAAAAALLDCYSVQQRTRHCTLPNIHLLRIQ